VDWSMFGFLVLFGLGNNFHGYFIMKTIEGTFNSKLYFIVRVFLQLVIIYTAVCIFLGKNMSWESLSLTKDTDPLYKRARFYTTILATISIIVCSFVIYSARKLIKVKVSTHTDLVRSGVGYNSNLISAVNTK
jgi:hypothetical protein